MRSSKPIILGLFCFTLFILAISLINTTSVTAGGAPPPTESDDCVIPPSGPWPSCATGDNNPPDDDCVIPPSGPWPPCATGGNNPPDDNCVIPPSGPWPPCATGGNSPPNNECVIPPVGPWPACAGGPGPIDPDPVAVNEFRIEPPNPAPGQIATIFWNVSNARSVEIQVGSGFIANLLAEPVTDPSNLDLLQVFYDLPVVGQLQVQMPPRSCITELPISLSANTLESNGVPADSFSVTYPPYQWLFDANALEVENECPRGAMQGRLVEQRFQNGWMIESEATGVVYFMIEFSTQYSDYGWIALNDFDPAIDPVSDPSLIPPAGFGQPINAIGKVWRENQLIRDELGWAVGDPITHYGYSQTYRQGTRRDFAYGVLLSGSDGKVWHIKARGLANPTWEKTSISNPQ